MNGKKARLARKLSIALSQSPNETSYGIHKKTGQIKLNPKCTRAVYQDIKRLYKKQAKLGAPVP